MPCKSANVSRPQGVHQMCRSYTVGQLRKIGSRLGPCLAEPNASTPNNTERSGRKQPQLAVKLVAPG